MAAIATTCMAHKINDPTLSGGIGNFPVEVRLVPLGIVLPDDATPEVVALITSPYRFTASSTGGWVILLPASPEIPFPHYYEATERIPSQFGGTVVTAFCVPCPTSGDISIENHLYTPAPPGPPDA